MNFLTMFFAARAGDASAKEALFMFYLPLITKYATVDGYFDEDMFQDICELLLKCVNGFCVERYLQLH